MNLMSELHAFSATELGAAYAAGALSPVAVAQAVIAHRARWEPQLCATWAFDADETLTMARASEQRWQQAWSIRWRL